MNIKKIIDLGCGIKKTPGAIGVDTNTSINPDVMHDLNKFPYPFEDGYSDTVVLDNTLEHLNEPMKVLEEVNRILKDGGECIISVPYFRSKYAFCDPTHVKFFTFESLRYFDPDDKIFKNFRYTKAKFKIKKIEINKNQKNNIFMQMLIKFASKHKYFYETYLSNFFPFNELTFTLIKIK